MASPPLKGRHKRYKQLNRVFETWLLDAARKTRLHRGDTVRIPEKLNTMQLLRLTEYVCSTESSCSVTPAIINILDEAVSLRRQAMDCYETAARKNPKLTNETTLRANRTHLHFVRVLRRVLSLLRSAAAQTDQPEGHNNDTVAVTLTESINPFAVLPVDEPSDRPLGSQPPVLQSLDLADAAALVDQNNEESDQQFAILCFFQDARDIRKHLLGVWKRFYQGEISLAVAEKITDIAFGMLSDMDKALEQSHKSLSSTPQIHKTLGLNVDQLRGDISRVSSKISDDEKVVDASEFFCIAGWCTVYDFSDLCAARRNGEVERPKESYFYGHPFAPELLRLQPAIRKLADVAGDGPLDRIAGLDLDRFTRILVGACKRSWIPACLPVVCQVMLDIHNAFGGDCSFAYDTVRGTARQTIQSLEKFSTLVSGSMSQSSGLQKACEKTLTLLHDHLDIVLNDEYRASRKHTHELKPSTLLKALPLLSGHNLNRCYDHRYISSQWVINHNTVMLSAAYLYRATKLASSADFSWTGMDFIIAKQSKRGAYVRDADDATGYARHFDLALGSSVVDFARGTSKRPKSQYLSPKILTNARKLEPTPSYVLARQKVQSMPNSNTHHTNEFYAELYFTVHNAEKSKLPQKDHEPTALLGDLEKAFASDEAELIFDYLAVATQSTLLLMSIATIFDVELERIIKLKPLPIHEMVRAILRQAAEQPAGLQTTILSQIGPCISETIAVHSTESSSMIPDKPCNRWKWGTEHKLPTSAEFELSQAEVDIQHRAMDIVEEWKQAGDKQGDQIIRDIKVWADRELEKIGSIFRVERVDLFERTQSIGIKYSLGGLSW